MVDTQSETSDEVIDVVKPKSRTRFTREELADHERIYNRAYYARNKDIIRQPCPCPHCHKIFSDRSTMNKHLVKNLRCLLTRTEKRLKELEETN